MTATTNRAAFIRSYAETLLWSSTDDDGDPLDDRFGWDDFSAEARTTIGWDCNRFLDFADDLVCEDNRATESQYSADELAGHDFWLTRNGHGAGFWAGGWESEAGEKLTKLAKQFGEQDAYVGDDGKIYLSGGK